MLPNETIFQFYEGTNPTLYDILNGLNLNAGTSQLLANDIHLQTEVTTLYSDPYSGITFKPTKLYLLGELVQDGGLFYKRNATASASPVLPTDPTYWSGPYDVASLDGAVKWHEKPDFATANADFSEYNEGDKVHVVDASGDPTVTAGWASYRVIGVGLTKISEEESLDVVIPEATTTVKGLIEIATANEILALAANVSMTPQLLAQAMTNPSQTDLSNAGYYNCPFSGLQLRWDKDIDIGGSGPDPVVYPLAFSNNTLNISVTSVVVANDPKECGYVQGSESATGFDIELDNGFDNNWVSYLALGF